jgi:hypothetical protein
MEPNLRQAFHELSRALTSLPFLLDDLKGYAILQRALAECETILGEDEQQSALSAIEDGTDCVLDRLEDTQSNVAAAFQALTDLIGNGQ